MLFFFALHFKRKETGNEQLTQFSMLYNKKNAMPVKKTNLQNKNIARGNGVKAH